MSFRTDTQEWWKAVTFAPGTATNANPPGIGTLHTLQLPPDLSRRHIWLAAGAYIQKTVDAHWFLQGALLFSRGGERTGSLFWTDASSALSAAELATATRPIIRMRADASGSTMPSLRYQTDDKAGLGYKRDNLDIGCFTLRVDADQVEFHVEKTYYTIPVGDELSWVLGVRVQSES